MSTEPFDEEEIAVVRQLADEGETADAIANWCGVTRAEIEEVCARESISLLSAAA